MLIILKYYVGRYDIMTIKDILAGSDLLELLTFTAVNEIDLKVAPQKRSTLYYLQSGEHIKGFIVLACKHGIYDMNYFKQELRRCSESACFTFEIINEDESILFFSTYGTTNASYL